MQPHRILVVDDYVPAAQAIAQLLRIVGHTVATAYTADNIMQLAVEFQPDLVLLDIGLKGEADGVTVAKWLREEPRLDGLVLVAVTGRGNAEHDDYIASAGFDHYLVKPVGLEQLDAIISALPERSAGTKGQ
ncbi:MAG: response regulator [Gemmatimonadaceae bacterium]|jgi:DNA-binding response OmpR family regulator